MGTAGVFPRALFPLDGSLSSVYTGKNRLPKGKRSVSPTMYHFESDYVNGTLPQVLEALTATNGEETVGYGLDPHCERARTLIRAACQAPEAQVSFLLGGTQANTTVIAAALRPHQGVLCADTGHINVHESGAIEATGHKVLPLPAENGKLSARQIRAAWTAHWSDVCHEHMVQPGMVYLSQPTEIGTLYSKGELEDISRVCRECGLFLYADGARLSYALAAPDNDLSLPDLARLTDVFYIGGTKTGLLFGEAVVITNDLLKRDFRYHIKQHGGMLAKGRLLGVQFAALFTDELYLKAGRHAIDAARRLRTAFLKAGVPFFADSPTNQQFVILTKEQQRLLSQHFIYEYWAKVDGHRDAVRFCTSWSTSDAALEQLEADLLAMSCR